MERETGLRKKLIPLLMIYLLVLSTGCVKLFKAPEDDAYARIVIGRLLAQNEELTRFKGLAKVKMTDEGRSRSGRIAFAAVRPDRMRVELLNTMGTPLTSLAGDGDHISILSHIDKKHYRIRQSRKALESVIHLPIGIEDLQSLLAGLVPLPPYAFARFEETDGPEDVVVLKNRWHGTVSRLRVDSRTHQIQNMQVFNGEGQLYYQIHWHQWHENGEFTMPSKVTIESLSHQSLELVMDRFWPNAQVAPSTFMLDLSHL
jgi:outer membrane biogenesis lipoprotein LolB